MKRLHAPLAPLLLSVACQPATPVAPVVPDAATRPARGGPPYSSVRVDGIPHVKQKPDFCGEACAEMVLHKLGHDEYDQDAVFDLTGVNPLQARGAYTPELKRALEAIGFEPGPVFHRVEARAAEEQLEARFAELHADLLLGLPSIVCTHYDESPDTTEHFRLVLGYDGETDEVIFHEPAVARGGQMRMSRPRLLRLWPLKYDREVWTVIRFRMAVEAVAPYERPHGFTPADFAQHCMALKPRLESGKFNMLIEPPFVVIGDLPRRELAVFAEHTVRASVRALKHGYFGRDPDEILDIWLFRNDASYRRHTRALFGDDPGTPFGYYSEEHKALIMNIDTGGGTLIHEIVHPFVAANFPDCPAWFNEGLGSLYEQSSIRGTSIRGLTNWRLQGLQAAIGSGVVPSFEQLTSLSEAQFYGEDQGTNYAQSRYLCYYLQEQGKLRQFYREFLARRAEDPTGYATLQRVLGVKDIKAFRKTWEEYVLGLSFP